jgi:DNA topoisomerase-1
VNAQQARRALDFTWSASTSPLCGRKCARDVRRPRCSPALRMICKREEEIEAFKAQEY